VAFLHFWAFPLVQGVDHAGGLVLHRWQRNTLVIPVWRPSAWQLLRANAVIGPPAGNFTISANSPWPFSC